MFIKRNSKYCLIGIIIYFFNINYAYSIDGVSIGSGYGVSDIVPIRTGVQWSWDEQWLTDNKWPLGGYWETSFYHMNGKKGVEPPNSNSKISAIAFAPVFRFSKTTTDNSQPYVELAVGVSRMNKKEVGGRELGIHFQFEDRIGFGVRFGKNRRFDLSYRAVHFSNAYLGPKNHGINLHLIILGYWF